MATYSPPTTPNVDPNMREELLRRLDKEIMATQDRHDETQRQLRERRWATSYQPGHFENALHVDRSDTVPLPRMGNLHDYSFNLTGIVPLQPPKWKQWSIIFMKILKM